MSINGKCSNFHPLIILIYVGYISIFSACIENYFPHILNMIHP